MISPITVATGGHLYLTLGLAVDGYLSRKDFPITKPKLGISLPNKATKTNIQDFRLEEDSEMLLIIKLFLKCQ